MLSYLTNLIILFLLLAKISESQTSSSTTSTTSTSSSSTTTATPVTTSTTKSSTSSTTSSTSSSTTSTSSSSSTTKSSNVSVTTIKLIKTNVTSNYYLHQFSSPNQNLTLPFAINECSSYSLDTNNSYIKPICVSNRLLNVTFYNNSACTSKPKRYEMINDTSLFRCNASNNYVELSMTFNTSFCPSKIKTYVGINHCFPLFSGSYGSILCSGKYVQFANFNSSSCISGGLLTISQVNSTLCGDFFSNTSIYASLVECINNASTTSTSTSTSSTSSSSSSTTTKPVTTISTSSTSSSSSTSTTKSVKVSSGSSIFINNVVYILSIITIINILC